MPRANNTIMFPRCVFRDCKCRLTTGKDNVQARARAYVCAFASVSIKQLALRSNCRVLDHRATPCEHEGEGYGLLQTGIYLTQISYSCSEVEIGFARHVTRDSPQERSSPTRTPRCISEVDWKNRNELKTQRELLRMRMTLGFHLFRQSSGSITRRHSLERENNRLRSILLREGNFFSPSRRGYHKGFCESGTIRSAT